MYHRCSSFLLATMALLTLAGVARGAATSWCPDMGTGGLPPKYILPTCLTFYTTGPAIKAPADSATKCYGQVIYTQSTFFDRSGKEYQYPPDVLQFNVDSIEGAALSSQIIFAAEFSKNKTIKRITPVLVVHIKAMIKPFMNSQYISKIINNQPPIDVIGSPWARWNFGSQIINSSVFGTASRALKGTFVNVRNGTLYKKSCKPKVIQTKGDAEWYTPTLGKSQSMLFTWFPGMHAPGDSEYNVQFSSGVNYMAGAPELWELLTLKRDLFRSKGYQFTIHGTPVEVLFQFDGNFEPATKVTYC